MAGRDYQVTYRTRELDEDAPRPRIPTALDPYYYPEDRQELKDAVAMTKARNSRYRDDLREYESPVRSELSRDNVEAATTIMAVRDKTRAETTKTTYAVTDTGVEKESQVSSRARTTARGPAPADDLTSVSRNPRYRVDDDRDSARASVRTSARPYDDRNYARVERVYETERPRREGGAYVVDMRDADVIDVYTGNRARESDRGFGGYRNDPNNNYRVSYLREPPPRASGYRQSEAAYPAREDARTSASSLDRGPYMSGAKVGRAPGSAASQSQTNFRDAPVRTSTRVVEDDRRTMTAVQTPSPRTVRREEDDWVITEKTTTRDIRAPSVHGSFQDSSDNLRARTRETTREEGRKENYTSVKSPIDDYVMVSPPREAATEVSGRQPSNTTSLRSAMFRDDAYTNEERLRRRRSRSINFRDDDCRGHDVGDRYSERPGAEAAMMGKYLSHYEVDDEKDKKMDYEYTSRRGERDTRYEDQSFRETERYAPQRMKSRSQGGRARDDDDESYVDTYREKVTKTTYY